jgi:hypothetical protein
LLLQSAALANLNPGDAQYNPAVNPPFTPSYTIGPVPPQYSTLVASTSFSYNYAGTPAEAYSGNAISNVYKNSSGQLAFSYVFNNLNVAGGPRTEITRITINDPSNPWSGVTIFGTGSDASGNSTAVPGAFGSWTNGNPFDILRDSTNSSPSFFFNANNSGTELVSTTSDKSATIWFTTDAKRFTTTNIGMIDSGNVGTGNAYAPLVPEPSSALLVAIGAFGVALVGRRMRAK